MKVNKRYSIFDDVYILIWAASIVTLAAGEVNYTSDEMVETGLYQLIESNIGIANQSDDKVVADYGKNYSAFQTTNDSSQAAPTLLPPSYTLDSLTEVLVLDCNGISIDQKSGSIISPEIMPWKFSCRYKIVVDPNERINFTVNYFRTSGYCSDNHMRIMDGVDLIIPAVTTFCAENHPPNWFASQHNSVQIRVTRLNVFELDERALSDGYDITWHTILQENPVVETTSIYNKTKKDHPNNFGHSNSNSLRFKEKRNSSKFSDIKRFRPDCGGSPTESEGTIKFAERWIYPENLTCIWTFVGGLVEDTKNTSQFVKVTLRRFFYFESIDCAKYFVEVCVDCNSSEYEEEFVDGKVARYCGSEYLYLTPAVSFVGHEVKIKMFSDYEYRSSILIVFEKLNYNPDLMCKTSYSAAIGNFSTPGYPNSFPKYWECIWSITVPINHHLLFTVHDCQLKQAARGNKVLLYFRDGLSSPLADTKIISCDTLRNNFTSISNNVAFELLNFEARNVRLKIEWIAIDSGCNKSRTSFSGVITSPGYPNSPQLGTYCFWNITVNQGHVVEIKFADIDIENYVSVDDDCADNYVQIIDGSIEDDFKFEKICHAEVVSKFVSRTNWVYIVLKISNQPQSRRGIKFSYLAGNIGRSRYRWYLVCSRVWEHRKCLYFHTESVHECDAECNNEIPVRETGSKRIEGKSVQLELNTFNSPRNVVFKMEWWLKGCAYSIKGTKGTLYSPNFPRNYPDNANCKWKIITAPGSLVQLTVHYWHLERSKNCQFDALKIYAGSNAKSLHLTTLCGEIGQQNYGLTIASNFNTMFLTFTSDGSVSHSGFNASFLQISKHGSACGKDYKGAYGFLYSPSYPNLYRSHHNCFINLRVSPSYRAAVKVLDWGPNPNYMVYCVDVIKVYGANPNLLLKWFPQKNFLCSDYDHLYPEVVSSENEISINFQKETIDWSRGFKAIYFQTCGARLRSEFGIITSPDFMTIMMMPSNSSCDWTVEAPTVDYRVVLIFTKFKWTVSDELCRSHMVRVFDENNHTQADNNETLYFDNATSYYTGCCGPLPTPIFSYGNALTLDIKGLGDLEFVAFYVTLSPECIYQLRSCQSVTNSLQDHCEKTVKMFENQEIQVTFRNSSYRIQSGINQTIRCSINYVEIYKDGNLTETYCRGNTHMQELKVVSGMYWIIYLVDDDDKEVLDQEDKQVITNHTVSRIETVYDANGATSAVWKFAIFVTMVFTNYAF